MKTFISLLASLTVTAAMAQEINVSGTVIDYSNGEPVPYASVHLEGTMTGTSTDGDGNYSLRLPHGGTLVFSSIGYITAKEAVSVSMVLNIVLEPDSESLEETIVVAYGTATKSSFTGSASMLGSEAIEARVSTDVTAALAGTTPGVQII